MHTLRLWCQISGEVNVLQFDSQVTIKLPIPQHSVQYPIAGRHYDTIVDWCQARVNNITNYLGITQWD